MLHLPKYAIYFIDSHKILQIPLRLYASRFSLREEKGYFPFKFLNDETLNYVGPTPPLEDFIAFNDTPKEIAKKKAYVESLKNEPWRMSDNLMIYCERDVIVTTMGILCFTEQCLSIQKKLWKLFPIEKEENSLNFFFPFAPPHSVTLGGFS